MKRPRHNADVRLREAERSDDDVIRQTIEFMRTGGQLAPDLVEAYSGSWRVDDDEGAAYFTLSSDVRVTMFWEMLGTSVLEVHVQGEWWWRPYPGRKQRHQTPDLSVDVPRDDLAFRGWSGSRPWLRPEVQSLIYELLTEVFPRWRGSHGEPLDPTRPPSQVQHNMDERMRELERRASAGDQDAKLQLLHAQFRARPWLETWLAWRLEEANQQVWAKNAKWSPNCEPCGEVNADGVRYALDSALKVQSAIVRRDGHPTKTGYARQKIRKRYEGARTVVVGAKLLGSDGTWAFVVRPYLRRHPTQYGLNLESVLPGLPHQGVEPLTSAARYADTGWFQYIQGQPDHYLATPKEVELFVAPVAMQYWTEGPGAEHEADVCDRCGARTTHINAGFCPSLQGMGCQCGGAWVPSFDEPAQ